LSKSLRPYVLLLRSKLPPSNLAPFSFSLSLALALILSSILAGVDLLTLGRYLILSVSSILAVSLSVYIYNDLTDIEVDRLNKLDRPLVTGEASKKDALNLVILLSLSGLIIAFMVSLKFFFLIMIFFILFFLYSFPKMHFKSMFIIKDLVIASGTALTYLIGGSVIGTISVPIILMSIIGFVSALSTSIVKDFRDVRGDEIYKIKTFPIIWGPMLTIRLAIALVVSVGLATIIGYYQLGFNIAFPILATLAFAAWIYVLSPLLKNYNKQSYTTDLHSIILKKLTPICLSIQLLTILGSLLL